MSKSKDVKWCEFDKGADGRWHCRYCNQGAITTTMPVPTIVRECTGDGTTRPKVNPCKNCGYDYANDPDIAKP